MRNFFKLIHISLSLLLLIVLAWGVRVSLRGQYFHHWKYSDIAQSILNFSPEGVSFFRVVVISEVEEFSIPQLNRYFPGEHGGHIHAVSLNQNREFDFSPLVLVVRRDSVTQAIPAQSIKGIDTQFMSLDSWFYSAYKLVDQWTSSNGAMASLYKVKAGNAESAWYLKESMSVHLDELTLPSITLSNLILTTKMSSTTSTVSGSYDEVMLSCRQLKLDDRLFQDVTIKLIRPLVNLPLLLTHRRFQLLSLEELYFEATVPLTQLSDVLYAYIPILSDLKIHPEADGFRVHGRIHGIPFSVRCDLSVHGQILAAQLKSLQILGFGIPQVFIQPWAHREIFLGPSGFLPFRFNLKMVKGEGDNVRIVS